MEERLSERWWRYYEIVNTERVKVLETEARKAANRGKRKA